MKVGNAVIDVRPFRTSPAFRRLWIGTTLATLAGQLAVVAVLYQAWEITHSPIATGAVGLSRALPMVVLGVIGGSLADAMDRRKLVLTTTVGQMVAALLLAGQAVAGLESLWLLLGLVALQSSCAALGAPARRTFAVRLLPTEQVSAGIALTHISFQVALLLGPAMGGLLIAWSGVAACYALDAAMMLAAFYGVLRLPAMPPLPSTDPDGGDPNGNHDPDGAGEATGPARPGLRTIVQGWRFVLRKPVLHGSLLTDLIATLTAMPISLFPMVVDERFGGDPQMLGFFMSAIGIGGIGIGALSGLITRSNRPALVMLGAATVWGIALAGFGLAQPAWLVLGCLVIAGAADTVSVISRGTIVQLATPDAYRGRVSSVEHVIGASIPDVGNFRGGVVAGLTSASFSLVSGGVACTVLVLALAATNKPLRRFTLADATPDPATSSVAAARE